MTKATMGKGHERTERSTRRAARDPASSTEIGVEWNFAAFEEWVGGCEDKAFRLAMHFLRDEQTVQEILQKTFLEAWENIQACASRARFHAWVYRTTIQSALARLNSTRSEGRESEDCDLLSLYTIRAFWCRLMVEEDSDWAMRTPHQLRSEDLFRHIRKTVDSLPIGLRSVFVTCDLEGMSVEDSADILGLPVRTVQERQQAATLAVRHAIGHYFARGASRGKLSQGAACSVLRN